RRMQTDFYLGLLGPGERCHDRRNTAVDHVARTGGSEMMARITHLLAAVAAVAGAACASCSRPPSDAGERIAVFTKNQTNPFFQSVRLGADNAARQMHVA